MLRSVVRNAAAFVLSIGMIAGVRVAQARAGTVTIFNADSLTSYVRDIARTAAAHDPKIQVRSEASGSQDAIRKVSDLELPCDIVISADWRLLARPHKGIEPWVVIFAGNRMGLLYTNNSRGAARIDAANWYRVLLNNGVRYGHSDPTRDPAGYWTLILWQLAERHYHVAGLAAQLAAHCPRRNLRPDSLALIALLQSGDLDYYFGYASDARLGGLRFLALPPAIDLGDLKLRAKYADVKVTFGPASARRTARGDVIAYGASLTTAAPDRADAITILKLMLSARGAAIAARNGLIPYRTPRSVDPEGKMPPELRALTTPMPPR